MSIGIIQFPGSNCDQDTYHALKNFLNCKVKFIWHKEEELGDIHSVIIPGGFSFGDYLRCGAIAQCSPIMKAVKSFAEAGGRVLGICNGFQILCESKLLPGALVSNNTLKFCCRTCDLTVEDAGVHWNPVEIKARLSLPIAHEEGNYQIDSQELMELERNHQVLLRYTDPSGNPNGSVSNIAAIRNQLGNVIGMMPHPERAVAPFHPSQDGIIFLKAWLSTEPTKDLKYNGNPFFVSD